MPVPVISIGQMREWETATWATGETEIEVIRRVGRSAAERVLSLTRQGDFILVLAGKGNHGADARAMLEHLDERRADILDVKNPETDFAELESLLSLRPALVIDGLFGIGLNRPLDSAWIKFVERINAAGLNVCSLDVPSGLDAETGGTQGAAVNAAMTLAIGAPKTGLLSPAAWPHVGRLEVLSEVGLVRCPHTSELNWILRQDFDGFPPPRPAASHKGSFGHAGIVAGSVGYHGAAVLASRAAQRGRPGLVTLFTHESAYPAAAAQLQAVMVHPWSPGLQLVGQSSALLAGPGLAAPAVPAEMKAAVRRWWAELPGPMIVDASALEWLRQEPGLKNTTRVITPHPGEAGRLLNLSAARIQADRIGALRELSRRFGDCWVVLKGHQTLIGRSSGTVFVNSSGNPELAQGGSGDVLAGYLTGLLAQSPLQANVLKTLCFAVWQHGATADYLQMTRPNWVVEDLAEGLGSAR